MDGSLKDLNKLSPSELAEALATLSGIKPPPGQVSNFANPGGRADIGITIITIFLVLVVMTGACRLYSRVSVVQALKLEDYLGFAAYLPFFAVAGVIYHIIGTVGFIVDEWNITLGALRQWSMSLFIFRPLYALVMLLAKTAILLEWKGLFVPAGKKNWFFWATTAMIVVNIVAYTVAIIMSCLRCRPVSKVWDFWVDGTCSNQKSTDVATSYINLAMDVVILLIPQPIIWELKTTRQRRIGVSLVFSIGLLAVACAIGRVQNNHSIDYNGNLTRGGSVNLIWAYGEATFVLVVFAAPGVPKAFRNQPFLASVISMFSSWTRLSDGSRDNNGGSGQRNGHPWVRTIGGGSSGRGRRPTATELMLIETQNADEMEAGIVKARMETQENTISKASIEQITERR